MRGCVNYIYIASVLKKFNFYLPIIRIIKLIFQLFCKKKKKKNKKEKKREKKTDLRVLDTVDSEKYISRKKCRNSVCL